MLNEMWYVQAMLVEDIIKVKGDQVFTLPLDATVADLLQVLVQKKIGAVVITGADTVMGIVSERDVVRFANEKGDMESSVAAIMTTEVIMCHPEDEVHEVARMMTDLRIRHLPVVEKGEVKGMVSIGDLVKSRLDDLEAERDHLVDYVKS